MIDPTFVSSNPKTFRAVRSTGSTVIRLQLQWSAAAAAAPVNAADPSDPSYHWTAFDREVTLALANGLTPIANIVDAPAWAKSVPANASGPGTPDPAALGAFAQAAARRYAGLQNGEPRVRYWQVWNEPNLDPDLTPQLVGGAPVSPGNYRRMVNAFAAGVKSVHADNLVVAGGLAPFRDITPDTLSQNTDWGPLSFMRDLLCLSATLKPTCSTPVKFDVWSMHPYTSGGPTHHAVLENDVSLGDLGKMRAVLSAAAAAHHIRSRGPVRFWVTEFSWDSKPPDPHGVPDALLRRWVPQALYQMWLNGVSVITWFSLADSPVTQSLYQSGLFYHGGKRKPYFEGFRFPFVAFPRAHDVYVWGRTPWGLQGKVAVEQRRGGRWMNVGTLSTNAGGLFQHTFTLAQTGSLRARLSTTGETSLSFSLHAVPDQFFNPFGGPTILEPVKSPHASPAAR